MSNETPDAYVITWNAIIRIEIFDDPKRIVVYHLSKVTTPARIPTLEMTEFNGDECIPFEQRLKENRDKVAAFWRSRRPPKV